MATHLTGPKDDPHKGNRKHNVYKNPIRNSGIYKEQYNFRMEHGGTLAEAKAAWKAKTGKEWLTPSLLREPILPIPIWNPAIIYTGEAPEQDIKVKKPTTKRQQRENKDVKNLFLRSQRAKLSVPVGFTNNDADVIWETEEELHIAEAKWSVGNLFAATGQVKGYGFKAHKAMLLGQRPTKHIVLHLVFDEHPSELAMEYATSEHVKVDVIGG